MVRNPRAKATDSNNAEYRRVDWINAWSGPWDLRTFLKIYSTSMLNGQTTPTASGSMAEFSKPTSLDVKRLVMGALANSCPEKCIAMQSDMYITETCLGVIMSFDLRRSMLLRFFLVLQDIDDDDINIDDDDDDVPS